MFELIIEINKKIRMNNERYSQTFYGCLCASYQYKERNEWRQFEVNGGVFQQSDMTFNFASFKFKMKMAK